jgi:hypothetical protein
MNSNSEKENRGRWPFDPMQPGDHEPAQLPEELERVQKQTGRRASQPSPDYRKSEEKRK